MIQLAGNGIQTAQSTEGHSPVRILMPLAFVAKEAGGGVA